MEKGNWYRNLLPTLAVEVKKVPGAFSAAAYAMVDVVCCFEGLGGEDVFAVVDVFSFEGVF